MIHGDGTGLDNGPDLLAVHQFSDGCAAVPDQPGDFFERVGGVLGFLDDILPSAEDPPVRFPWRAREYERTCVKCGYTWRVPRSAARRRRRTISTFSVASPRTIDRAELRREVASISAENQQAEAFRECPKCGAVRFTQRSVRGEAPQGFAQ